MMGTWRPQAFSDTLGLTAFRGLHATYAPWSGYSGTCLNDAPNQQFKVEYVDSNYYRLVAKHSYTHYEGFFCTLG